VLEIKHSKGRLEEPAWRRGEGDPVPPIDGEADGDGALALALRDRPIDLIDIARVLGQSAAIERLGGAAVRACRDDLTLIRDSLSYATAVLAADVATLSDAGTQGTTEVPDMAAAVPSELFPSPGEDQWTSGGLDDLDLDALDDLDVDIDEGLFARTDHLLAAHREMARVDLSATAATTRVRLLVEEQLAILTERQAAVEARLQQIRAVIIRRYRLAAAPARDRPA
jgi:hypothetical protein